MRDNGFLDRLLVQACAVPKNLAVSLVVEAIDHDAVVASQVLEDSRRLVAQCRAASAAAEDRLHGIFDMLRKIDWGPRRFEFDY